MKTGLFFKNKRQIPFHLMMLPGMLFIIVYHYLPMFGVIMAFQKYMPTKGFFKSDWVGLSNFEYIFSMDNFKQVMFNTVFISIMKIVTHIVICIMVSLFLNEIGNKYFKRGLQTVIYFPHFLSWVLLSGIIIDILSPSKGIVNQIIMSMGQEPIFFLADNKWFQTILIVTNIWKEFGWGTIIYLAAITSIDPTLYEAAIADGAGRLKQTFYVTIPGILPIIVLTTVLSLGSVLNAGFDQVFNLYSPVVYKSGDILDTLVFRIGLQDLQFSVSTAIGLFKSAVALILILTSYRLADKIAGYRVI